MPDQPPMDALGEVLAKVALEVQRANEAEASGWLVVVTDLHDEPTIGSAYGPFETAEQALIVAGEFDACPHTGTHPADGSAGWRHDVVPLFAHTPKRGTAQ